MSRMVSKNEILQLHQFCVKHFVSYYDVRIELVDHLASSIEALWLQKPSLSFEDALHQVYKS